MTLESKQGKVLLMFSQLMRKFRKQYLYLSQEKMLELLGKYHGYRIKRRMLNYRLADLEAQGLIRRVQRNNRQVDGRIEPMTSLIFLTRKAHRLISRMYRALTRALGRKDAYSLHIDRPETEKPPDNLLSPQENIKKARELLTTLA
ncbi:MAG: hypothetical protein JRD89_04515 [Deltaproteobacteria bacterium]|nr:hypothetical protein [Deltaproteobacteria bacterium]